jgi:hypothetical protein
VAADNSMTAGMHYFFKYSVRNGEGDSLASDIKEVALAEYPTAPLATTKVDEESSLTSIFVEW